MNFLLKLSFRDNTVAFIKVFTEYFQNLYRIFQEVFVRQVLVATSTAKAA